MAPSTKAKTWGELAHPIRSDVPESGLPAWKDNAYLGFWDPTNEVYGAVHVSTSPNAEGRRARASVSVRGRSAEVVEDLEPGSFSSDSIAFDLDGRIEVRAAQLTADLELAPRFVPGDYSASEVVPPLVEGEPLRHLQQAAAVTGGVAVGSEESGVDGLGMRDRTWGFRDESASMPEYIGVIVGFPDRLLTVMRFARVGGGDRTAGFVLADEATEATGLTEIARDASGLFAAAQVSLAGGERFELRTTARSGGFWVPMGWERTGPTMSAYDEFVAIRSGDGEVGHGIVEQGIVRRLS